MNAANAAVALIATCSALLSTSCRGSVVARSEKNRPRAELSHQEAPSPQSAFAQQMGLGRRLFKDPGLSRDSSVSCATCHSPFRAFTESRAVSVGVGIRARIRNAPSLINVAFHLAPFDWDGRANNLAQQLDGVFAAGGDMDIDLTLAVERLRRDSSYVTAFSGAYGRGPDVEGFIQALVAFETSLVDNGSRFDRYYLGGDSTALSESERRGWQLFRSAKAGCAGCHVPVPDPKSGMILFQDHRFHNLGVGYQNGRMSDSGRSRVTNKPSDWGAFRTPSLRNVALTSPYMHDGSLATLRDVIAFYARGGTENPNRDVVIGKRALTKQDRADLIAFMHTLTTDWLQDSVAVAKRLLPAAITGKR